MLLQLEKSDKQSLSKKLNLVQNQESSTGDPLKPERIYQNFQSLVLREEDHSNFLKLGQRKCF